MPRGDHPTAIPAANLLKQRVPALRVATHSLSVRILWCADMRWTCSRRSSAHIPVDCSACECQHSIFLVWYIFGVEDAPTSEIPVGRTGPISLVKLLVGKKLNLGRQNHYAVPEFRSVSYFLVVWVLIRCFAYEQTAWHVSTILASQIRVRILPDPNSTSSLHYYGETARV